MSPTAIANFADRSECRDRWSNFEIDGGGGGGGKGAPLVNIAGWHRAPFITRAEGAKFRFRLRSSCFLCYIDTKNTKNV